MIALMLFTACSSTPEAEGAAAPRTLASSRASRVEVAVLEAADATLELDLPGEVGGQSDANLAAANGGFVERVLVEEGQQVRDGQTLVRVDASLYAAQLEQAEAQLEQAEADLRRLEALGDLAAPAQLESARTGQRVAAANVSQARNRLSRAVVKAPFDGVVAAVAVEEGEAVGPGTPVVRVVQLDPATITLSVSDRDVVALVPGTEVEVSAASRSGSFRGHVALVAPAADLRTRAFPVEVEVENPDRLLLPGMIARVRVQRPVLEDAMVVPQDWLVTRRDERGVFVEVDATARWRDVVLGDVIHDKVVVTSGIEPGDRVVVTGHRDLVDGDPLVVTREGTCCSEGRPVFAQAR
jgi:membrane fusion protein (multidrug efflux system)